MDYNKKVVLYILFIGILSGCKSQSAADMAWRELYPAVEKQIIAPVFPGKEYIITDFGAVPNDPAALNHEQINQAIAACSDAGGGSCSDSGRCVAYRTDHT
ncbi:MAG: hypothetical protein AB2L24_18755 [Mangrovibacterium sp.]